MQQLYDVKVFRKLLFLPKRTQSNACLFSIVFPLEGVFQRVTPVAH